MIEIVSIALRRPCYSSALHACIAHIIERADGGAHLRPVNKSLREAESDRVLVPAG